MLTKALVEVIENEHTQIKNYVRTRFNAINEYDAEDIIQQTVLKLLTRGNDALSIQNMSAYIYSAVRNSAIDHLRKRKHEVLNIDDIDIEDSITVESQILLSELKSLMKNAIKLLDEKSKFVFVEIEIKGHSYKELSQKTGVKLGTLISRKSRAMDKLRKILYEYVKGV